MRKKKRDALRAINTIKQKRCGTIKGRIVSDDIPQRKTYEKKDRLSSTCHNEALMMSLMIEAKEGRFIGTGDVPGAYLHA